MPFVSLQITYVHLWLIILTDFFYSYRFYLEVGTEGRGTIDREEEKKAGLF